jgi:cytochrome P450
MNFMSAGHETTAGALVWAVLSMCLHPDIQHRLRNEIRENILHNDPPKYGELEKLQYMNNFVKEVLRCFPPCKDVDPQEVDKILMTLPATRVPRAPIRPIVLDSVPGLVIPAGTSLTIHPAVLSFNPTIWGPDAHIFNPGRHDLNHPSGKDYPGSRDPYALAAFSNGPRICIGRGFAMLEIKSILVQMLRIWEVERGWGKGGERLDVGEELEVDRKSDEGDTDEKISPENELFGGVTVQNFISLRPRDGLWVRFKKIEGK